jgi:hypothetical protein
MSSDTPAVGFTLRNLEDSLAAKSSAAPKTEAKRTAAPVRRPSQGFTVIEPDEPSEPPVRILAKKKAPAPAAAPKPPVVNEPILLFNIAYEVLRNAKDARDPNTPDLAYELYSLDIADRRDRWSETKASLIDFIKVNKQYLLSLDSKTRWVQQFGQRL